MIWKVVSTVGVIVAATVIIGVGCDVAPGLPKVASTKPDEGGQKGAALATPTFVQQMAQVKDTATARPAVIPTPSPAAPTATRTPTPVPPPVADIVFARDGNLWLAQVKDGSQIPLTVDGGNSSPRWSPDGGSVVFVHNTGSGTELQRTIATGSNRHRLIGGDALYLDPQWSPSGDAILFVVKRDTNKDGKVDEKDTSEVWVMNADGSSPIKIAEGTEAAWAPEGLRIAFATNGKLEKDAPYRRANAINVVNRQGKNEWTLTSTAKVPSEITLGGNKFNSGVFLLRSPVWSSASKLIAFTAVGHTGMILTVSEKATDLRTWGANYEGGFGRSVWSPAGDRLAYESLPASGIGGISIGEQSSARVVAVGGGRSGLSVHSPTWSPDGRFLAFTQESGTKFIGVVRSDGEDLRQLASGNVSDPHWNPKISPR